ncbi:MAG TPA: hypothetical protein VFS43_40775 [Polyangiaceae bacterium]|nr:hypothetical protein [Polyangiaceae bacterium]
MDSWFDEAKRDVKAALTHLGKEGLPRSLGLRFRKEGPRVWVNCPWHADENPSATLSIGEEGTLRLHCYSGCGGRSGDALDLVAHARGLDIRTQFQETVAEGAGVAGLYELEARLCEELGRPRPPPRKRRPAPVAPAPGPLEPARPRGYPPPGEVKALWDAARALVDYRQVGEFEQETVVADPEANALLEGRGLSPEAVTDLDLVRVLVPDVPLPRWASYQGERRAPAPWTETGHRLVVPAYDALGRLCSVRAWRVGPPRLESEKKVKRLPPSGFTTKGLVLADRVGRQMLEEGRAPDWWPKGEPFRVVVCEGEPDLVTVALHWHDAAPCPDAVLGIPGSGSWTPEIAARVPDGAEVWLHPHHDGPGDDYAAEINAQLKHRCAVFRGEPEAA